MKCTHVNISVILLYIDNMMLKIIDYVPPTGLEGELELQPKTKIQNGFKKFKNTNQLNKNLNYC